MDLHYTDADEVFRAETRSALARMLPPEITARTRRGFHASKVEMQTWNRILHRAGWSAPHWPSEYGGTGWPPLWQYIFSDECAALDAPAVSVHGLKLVGPVIYTFGNAEQKARHLPAILAGDVFWCQGYSEPGAGSDLAQLATRAVRDGGDYLVTGRKIWTSDAHLADRIFCLVRTDTTARPQKGISFLLIDMALPGLSIRPIVSIDGQHSLNEVTFDEVRVPAADLIGLENEGWTYAKFLLRNERTGIAEVQLTKRRLRMLKDIGVQEVRDGRRLIDGPEFRRCLAEAEIDLLALEWSLLRIICGEVQDVTAASSALKIQGSVLQQKIASLGVEAASAQGLEFFSAETEAPDWPSNSVSPEVPNYVPGQLAQHFYRRAATIYGGTNEIQRNILAKELMSGRR